MLATITRVNLMSGLMRVPGMAACALAAGLMAAYAGAAEYPTHSIRYVVPSAPGGNADIVARLIAQRLTDSLGQQVVVDNRAGASNMLGTELVVKSPPDGYTLLQIASAHFTNPSIVKKLPYDSERDLAPISLLSSTPLVLVAHPSLPVKSAKDLVALAKARPGQLNYSSAGVATTGHLAGALFAYMAHVNVVHVPYKGTAQAMTDVISGDLHFSIPSLTSGLEFVRQGRLKALGITASKRSPLAPNLSTISESGVPGYQANIWNGVLAPAGTPQAVISKLNAEIIRILSSPEAHERFASAGSDVAPSSPAELGSFISAEIKKWAAVIKAAGIKPE